MKIVPLFDRVLLSPLPKQQSSLELPENLDNSSDIGIVVSVGNDEKIVVKKDDKVVFNKFATSEVRVDNTTLLLIKQIDILGKIEE